MNLDKLADEFESLSIEDKIKQIFHILDLPFGNNINEERKRLNNFYEKIISKNNFNGVILGCCKEANKSTIVDIKNANLDTNLDTKQKALRLVKLEIAKNREKKIDEILND